MVPRDPPLGGLWHSLIFGLDKQWVREGYQDREVGREVREVVRGRGRRGRDSKKQGGGGGGGLCIIKGYCNVVDGMSVSP